MSGERLIFGIVNDIAELPRLAEAVDRFCARQAVPADCAFALNLVLEELVTNTMSYGYDDGARHEIAISLARENGAVTLELSDDARPFDPLQAREPDLDAPLAERAVGGLGIHLVKTMMDAVEYSYADGRNRLRLTKRIASAAG